MSATNRGTVRNEQDYYVTPQKTIKDFLNAFLSTELRQGLYGATILDPCAGGDLSNLMAYPTALAAYGLSVDTMDLREDSRAAVISDYLTATVSPYSCIITNPPYAIAIDFIEKALADVLPGGCVIMLLRINFFGAQKRNAFFKKHMPHSVFIHSERPNFFTKEMKKERKLLGKKSGTDATEYAHFVWQRGYTERYSKTYVI